VKSITDIRGKKIALGDVNSTSSFNVPVAMMMQNGVQPAKEAAVINMAGSHANVLNALSEGLVDVGGASFDSFEKAVNAKAIDPTRLRVVAKSAPIPYPPLAINTAVPASIKTRLREAFDTVHTMPGISKDQIRGYGGTKVDAYTSKVSEEQMAAAGKMFELVTDSVRQDIMKKAAQR
jgi:phosphonate transport system substrate-binding protein